MEPAGSGSDLYAASVIAYSSFSEPVANPTSCLARQLVAAEMSGRTKTNIHYAYDSCHKCRERNAALSLPFNANRGRALLTKFGSDLQGRF
jgi:hypothetical protein